MAFLPSVFLAQPPLFLAPPQLGIYVAVKCPHDLYYHRNRYYLWWHNRWFTAPSYNGPWRVLADPQLPGPLRTNDISAQSGNSVMLNTAVIFATNNDNRHQSSGTEPRSVCDEVIHKSHLLPEQTC
jgi:hypothetical protein